MQNPTKKIALVAMEAPSGGVLLALEGDQPILTVWSGDIEIRVTVPVRRLADLAQFHHELMRHALGEGGAPAPVSFGRLITLDSPQ